MQLFTLMYFFFCMLPFKNLELNGETEIPHPYGRFFPLCWTVNHGEKVMQYIHLYLCCFSYTVLTDIT